jgi:hypothetical protein
MRIYYSSLLGTPLREDCSWVCVDVVLRGKSLDLGLSKAEEKDFISATVLMLINVNHQREVFAKLRFPMSQSMKRVKLRMTPADS